MNPSGFIVLKCHDKWKVDEKLLKLTIILLVEKIQSSFVRENE